MQAFQEIFSSVTYTGIRWAIASGHAGAVFALVALVIHFAGQRWLTASQKCFLWGLVILRMAMPFAPPSTLSVHRLIIPLYESASANRVQETATEDQVFYINTSATPHPDSIPPEAYAAAPANQASATLGEWLKFTIPLLWLSGAIFVVATTLLSHWRFRSKLAALEESTDERLTSLLQSCQREVWTLQRLRLVECDLVNQPAVVGIWSPCLLLPSHCLNLSDAQLRLIMLHELMHVRCWDVVANWLLVLVRAMQWWNPFFWLAQHFFVDLREQSRDAMVLRHVHGEPQQQKTYSELLLELAARPQSRGWTVALPVSLLGFLSGWFRRTSIASRLRAIANGTKLQHWWHWGLVVGLMLVVAIIGLTDAAQPRAEKRKSSMWTKVDANTPGILADAVMVHDGALPTEEAGPREVKEYDVTSAIGHFQTQEQVSLEEAMRVLQLELEIFVQPPNRATMAEVEKHLSVTLEESDGQWIAAIEATQEGHQRVGAIIQAWNRSGPGQVCVEMRIATSGINIVEELGLSWDRIVSQPLSRDEQKTEQPAASDRPQASGVSSVEKQVPMLIRMLDDGEMRRFMTNAQSDVQANIMMAPKVTLFNGQTATIWSGVQRPFVTGLGPAPDGTIKPQLEIISEGFQVDLQTVINPEHTATDLSLKLELSNVDEVETYSMKLQGKDVTVQVPSVSRLKVNTLAQLQNSQTLVVCVPPTYDQTEYTWFLITPRIVEPVASPTATAP
ncbi:MAG: M56 family metallopeptidase [Planctomycetaceae bacterium]